MKKVVLTLLIIVIAIPSGWILFYKYEGGKPVVSVDMPSVYLKKSYEMSLNAVDEKTGLRSIMVSIEQKDKKKILLEKRYETAGVLELFSGPKTVKDSYTVPVCAWKYGMTDGEAVIRIVVSDSSWRGWNSGNVLTIEKKVIIDSKPPKLNILTKHHNIEKGGSALIIYELFEDGLKTGVKVDDNFFPGHTGLFDNKNIYAAFFALSDRQGPGTDIAVLAQDTAGNVTKRGFYHYIRDKKFKKDILNIPDSFLKTKMPQFDIGESEVSFENRKNPLLEKFLFVNSKIREKNVQHILSIPLISENSKYWDGRFLRMRGSAKRSGFGDRRIYKYKKRKISKAVHMGIDLASISNASIKAANAGRVISAEFIGIFGNTVIIDHGFGLCSLYSHLDQIMVSRGDMVDKDDEIGSTGMTGLAGGDHLHFSMIVHNVFVNPVEWWDKNWIKNNITSKIDYVNQLID